MIKKLYHTVILLSVLCMAYGYAFSSPSGRSVHQIVSELRRYKSAQEYDINVPPEVSNNLTELKHSLRDLIIEFAGKPDTANADPSILSENIVKRLESEDVPVGDEGDFGSIREIELKIPKDYPNWLIATTSLGIPFGVDVSLYVFERHGSTWKHALTLESNGYKTIHDAQGWLEYNIARPVPGTKPYLVTTEISPNSVSVWQALRLRILRVGTTPEKPTLLAMRSLGYCLDQPYFISVRPNGFGLIYLGFAVDNELAGWRGVHYLEYAVAEKTASIVRESAVDPYNLIRKWAAQSWEKALRIVDPAGRGNARVWHQRFHHSSWACGLGQIHLDHNVEDGKDQLLAEARCEEGRNQTASAYAVIAARNDGFHIASISDTPLPSDEEGEVIYNANAPGVIQPVPEHIRQPRLPPDTPSSISQPVKLRLSITVNEDGAVGSVSVLNWPDDELKIVVPAIQAVKTWKYKPGTMNGKPVKVTLEVEVVFDR
jgi:hypothetical protein